MKELLDAPRLNRLLLRSALETARAYVALDAAEKGTMVTRLEQALTVAVAAAAKKAAEAAIEKLALEYELEARRRHTQAAALLWGWLVVG